mmetsp:Transcript_35071/g.51507  ORF Transcript_35071/g.51507 Transcript_35071/m.51507 type:complete len:386 (-) Transcript_35071:19-1176(-)|eukprot:CAMPEP_0195508532 /NCGR_PEP_ID=MMETSP0794_2-20130614/1720_1 /TAXON_ID=515487 /ORGANISM="Stephanopyxis turris, Strain CCMP 815" /LENGTH=385 /DNA_ID=CAMNT_0040635521 /DNA_START=57 /DNA_END=1214 /DNA_ORIENTATION=+
MASSTSPFEIKLSFKGSSSTLKNVTSETTVEDLHARARTELGLANDVVLKLIHKGKVLGKGTTGAAPAFPDGIAKAKSLPKVFVMATSDKKVTELNSSRSDPTIRGFDNERQQTTKAKNVAWGENTGQNKNFKFCRFESCTWQSFGHRTGSKTPHAFKAMQLLEKLATDPGVVAIMVERELVVGTLGEMDPIDDRLMHEKQQEGGCLLGYNTNAGARIDLKLRTDDLNGFLPYADLASTLIHELSHNWVGEHNALFWSNYGQMRVEYLHKHASLAMSGYYINGKTSAELAGVAEQCQNGMVTICEAVVAELTKETAQHSVPVQMVVPAVVARCKEMKIEGQGSELGQQLGGSHLNGTNTTASSDRSTTRDLAFAAAERRAREKKK